MRGVKYARKRETRCLAPVRQEVLMTFVRSAITAVTSRSHVRWVVPVTFAAALVTAPTIGSAQITSGKVTGIVTDAQSAQPLAVDCETTA